MQNCAFLLGLLENRLIAWKTLLVGLRSPSVRLERNVIIKGSTSRLKLGRGVVIQSGSVLHLGGQRWNHREGKIVIGNHSVISPNCVLYGAGPGGIRIGNNLDCGPFVGIYASRSDYRNPGKHVFAEVVIGNDVTIYSHVVICPGVQIGDSSVIAAGSVVLSDVPSKAFVGGAPAQILREEAR